MLMFNKWMPTTMSYMRLYGCVITVITSYTHTNENNTLIDFFNNFVHILLNKTFTPIDDDDVHTAYNLIIQRAHISRSENSEIIPIIIIFGVEFQLNISVLY